MAGDLYKSQRKRDSDERYTQYIIIGIQSRRQEVFARDIMKGPRPYVIVYINVAHTPF